MSCKLIPDNASSNSGLYINNFKRHMKKPQAINKKLTEILKDFHTDYLSKEVIDKEVEIVRQEMFEKKIVK